MVTRIVVGAHYGFKDWLAQRVTAVYMALYTLLLALALLFCVNGYESWRALMSNGVVRFLSVLFILCLCYHAWVGVRDIWMDYVKSTAVRLTLHILTLLVLVGNAVWAVQILWRL
ncbi:MAG: succinate dehydrogenase, hydrophobic membrane anchor protein [Zoogloeaceae bacterium]|jgi:succinate dehydrogenase / fumarate reductase membrane anchor subunit|nr:succinate dehydrogenase, hydrophobic membrane anchor protein [Zoogloeaceae bacterium]